MPPTESTKMWVRSRIRDMDLAVGLDPGARGSSRLDTSLSLI